MILNGGWHASRATAHCARIPNEGVVTCKGVYESTTKEALAVLRTAFCKNRDERSSRKKMANERSSVLTNETAGSVETLAVRSSSSRTSVNQGGIAGSFHAQNTSMLSAAISDFIFGDALAFNIIDSPRFRRVIELSRNVPTTYVVPDRRAIATVYLP